MSDVALDSFLAFSSGPRQCLGRKFSTVEAVCFLSYLLRDWKFDLKLADGESPQAWQERVMRPELAITLKIGKDNQNTAVVLFTDDMITRENSPDSKSKTLMLVIARLLDGYCGA